MKDILQSVLNTYSIVWVYHCVNTAINYKLKLVSNNDWLKKSVDFFWDFAQEKNEIKINLLLVSPFSAPI